MNTCTICTKINLLYSVVGPNIENDDDIEDIRKVVDYL